MTLQHSLHGKMIVLASTAYRNINFSVHDPICMDRVQTH
jgi:hypothetical protein